MDVRTHFIRVLSSGAGVATTSSEKKKGSRLFDERRKPSALDNFNDHTNVIAGSRRVMVWSMSGDLPLLKAGTASGAYEVVSKWYRSGIEVVSKWYRSGIEVVSKWYRSGIEVVSKWYRSGIEVEAVRRREARYDGASGDCRGTGLPAGQDRVGPHLAGRVRSDRGSDGRDELDGVEHQLGVVFGKESVVVDVEVGMSRAYLGGEDGE